MQQHESSVFDCLRRWLYLGGGCGSIDHYCGLTEAWNKGTIYCSTVTGRLVKHMLGVDEKYICALPTNRPQCVDGA